jgi:hypothetical protein
MDSRTHATATVLRDTILSVEQSAGVSPDHPDMRELKRIFLQKIADLEIGAPQPSIPSTNETPPALSRE